MTYVSHLRSVHLVLPKNLYTVLLTSRFGSYTSRGPASQKVRVSGASTLWGKRLTRSLQQGDFLTEGILQKEERATTQNTTIVHTRYSQYSLHPKLLFAFFSYAPTDQAFYLFSIELSKCFDPSACHWPYLVSGLYNIYIFKSRLQPIDFIITTLPVVTKDLPISPQFTPYGFYRDANSAILQLVNQWLNFTYSRSHAFRYVTEERTQILLSRLPHYY